MVLWNSWKNLQEIPERTAQLLKKSHKKLIEKISGEILRKEKSWSNPSLFEVIPGRFSGRIQEGIAGAILKKIVRRNPKETAGGNSEEKSGAFKVDIPKGTPHKS